MTARHILRSCGLLLLAMSLVCSCPFDETLREYLSAHFWLPFAKHSEDFEKLNIRRMSVPYAGMMAVKGDSPLEQMRAAYQPISQGDSKPFDVAPLQQKVAAARSQKSLTRREKEEVDLTDAKIDMRAGEGDEPRLLVTAKAKLEAFLRSARTPQFLSEARGWLAHVDYLLGDQTAAGKIYLDELNRNGSNLSRETLLNSLQMTYGYDGGPKLRARLDQYFDTPEHAAFAIQLVTNPHWNSVEENDRFGSTDCTSPSYGRVKDLLERHGDLLRANGGGERLVLLVMRVALRMGDPPAARKFAEAVPDDALIRAEPDFNWMLASAYYLSHEYASAERPLLTLFRSARASDAQRAAAAYGLCGVYWKTGNDLERLRYALWLHSAVLKQNMYPSWFGNGLSDLSVYWAASGWDLGMLLDAEASVDTLQTFIDQNPNLPEIRLVRYSLAVRLARENRYEEASEIYEAIHARRRAPRMRQLATLYEQANETALTREQMYEARYRLAEFIAANPEGIYYNDALWEGFQRYALQGSSDYRLTRAERQSLILTERKLKDDQEERWRAYQILRDVVNDAGNSEWGRKSAALAILCLRGISARFERQQEIRRADMEFSRWLLVTKNHPQV